MLSCEEALEQMSQALDSPLTGEEQGELDPKEPEYLKVVWGIGYKMEQHGT